VRQLVRQHRLHLTDGESRQQIEADAEAGATRAAPVAAQQDPGVCVHLEGDRFRGRHGRSPRQVAGDLEQARRIGRCQRDAIRRLGRQPQLPTEDAEQANRDAQQPGDERGHAEPRRKRRCDQEDERERSQTRHPQDRGNVKQENRYGRVPHEPGSRRRAEWLLIHDRCGRLVLGHGIKM